MTKSNFAKQNLVESQEVYDMTTVLKISGLHRNSCKWLIEDVCKDTKGVTSCNVNLASGETAIEHAEPLNFDVLKKAIESLGTYKVEEFTS